MTRQGVEFAEGHMGGSEIVLLDGGHIPVGRELEASLAVLDPPDIRGHQAAFLYEVSDTRLSAKIISVSSRGFISSCGGLTKVLGKVVLETDFMNKLQLRLDEPLARIELETSAGVVTILIESRRGRASRVVRWQHAEGEYRSAVEGH